MARFLCCVSKMARFLYCVSKMARFLCCVSKMAGFLCCVSKVARLLYCVSKIAGFLCCVSKVARLLYCVSKIAGFLCCVSKMAGFLYFDTFVKRQYRHIPNRLRLWIFYQSICQAFGYQSTPFSFIGIYSSVRSYYYTIKLFISIWPVSIKFPDFCDIFRILQFCLTIHLWTWLC